MKIFDKLRKKSGQARLTKRKNKECDTQLSFTEYQRNAAGQRLQTGDRSEMCSNTLNNNQRLTLLSMMRDIRNEDTGR